MNKKQINNKLIKASEIYADQTIIRAGINAIPFVGGSLDILLSSKGQNFISKRIQRLIKELELEIFELKEEQINKEYLETEEGFDLIIQTFNAASKTRQKEKLKLYAQVVKSAININKTYQEEEPELFLKIAEELSLKEFRVAMALYEIKETNFEEEKEKLKGQEEKLPNDAAWLSERYPEFDKDELVSIFIRLEKTGLIKELVGSFLGYGGGKYLINPLFKRFVNYLKKE
jgi:hypothetical protein